MFHRAGRQDESGGSFDHRCDRTTAHVLSAFARDAALILAHREAAAAPEAVGGVQALSADLAGSGVLITADALHCQNAPSPKPPPPATPCWCMSMTVLTPIRVGMIVWRLSAHDADGIDGQRRCFRVSIGVIRVRNYETQSIRP
ncbi:hypothetical protein [Azospirillum argentinense]